MKWARVLYDSPASLKHVRDSYSQAHRVQTTSDGEKTDQSDVENFLDFFVCNDDDDVLMYIHRS